MISIMRISPFGFCVAKVSTFFGFCNLRGDFFVNFVRFYALRRFDLILESMASILHSGVPVGLCSDHAGYEMKCIIEGYLESLGIAYKDFGTMSTDSCDYPDLAHPCATAVENGAVYPGIALCGSGNGIGMTLNKHQGVRAALCWNTELAALARQHNDANVLVLPARFIKPEEALNIVDVFLDTDFEGGRHERRIAKIPVDFSKV